MGKSSRMDKTSAGPWFWVAIVLLVFLIYSLVVAATTADDCGAGVDKEWVIFPPEWECKRSASFG